MKRQFFVVAAVIISSQLLAQQDSTSKSLDEVTVTATRFSKKISETGKVVTIIPRQELEKQGGKDLAQILNEQAGLVINGATSNPGKDKSVYLRGAKTNYTVILINGIPVTDPTGVGGAFDLRMLPVEQVERIEILKGAQSTLYGADAVAGVINIITKKGGGKQVNLFGGLSAGNYKTLKGDIGISGTMEGSSYNLIYAHNESNGVPEAIDTSLAQNAPDNGYNQNAISFDASMKLMKGLYLNPFLRHTHYGSTYSDGAFTPASNNYKSSMLNTGTQLQYHFTGGGLTAQFAYHEIDRSYTSSWGASSFYGDSKTAEIFGHYDLDKHLQLLAGYQFSAQKMFNPASVIKDTTARLNSPFASLYLKDIAGFNLEIGGRYNDHSQFGDHFTWSVNPSYLINERIKLFLNYGTAFKAPSLSELFGQWGANPDLKPERSNTLEGGVQTSLLDDKLSLRAVYFRRKIKDLIVYDNNFTYTNYDRQKDHGFEIEPTVRFNKHISLRLAYAYVTGEVTTSGTSKDTTYNNLIRRPKHSFGAHLSYQVTPSLFVSTGIQSFSKRNDLFFNSSTYTNDPVVLKAYTLWNAYAEYAFLNKKIRAFAQINNILDTDYMEVYGYSTLGTNATTGIRLKL